MHAAFIMNVSPPSGHLPAQYAVYCRQCSNTGRPVQIVPPNGVPLAKQVAFIRKHNAQYK